MHAKDYSTEDFICDESFQRYARGEAPDVLRWQTFIRDHPHKLADITEAVKVIAILNGRQGNLQQQLADLRDSVKRYDDLRTSLPETAVRKISRRAIFTYATAIAASLVIISGSFYLSYRNNKPSGRPDAAIIYSSGTAPRKTIVLPDNSVVTLHSNSTLALSGGFSKNNRELTLSGEGFFDVVHDGAHPFIVHTADVNIEVLGTVFNVSAYPADHHTETSLFRGKVAISAKDHPEQKMILTPSKKILIANGPQSAASPQAIALAADPVNHKAKEIAWVRNRLKIEDEPLSAIAGKLQAWYGISIGFEDNDVKAYRYSGTFESETVLKALEALQLSYPFSFRVEKEQIIIGK